MAVAFSGFLLCCLACGESSADNDRLSNKTALAFARRPHLLLFFLFSSVLSDRLMAVLIGRGGQALY